MSSKFGDIRPLTTELAALECLKKSYRLIMEKMTSSHFSAIFHLILFILEGNEDMHKSLDEFEILPDPTTGFHVNRKCYNLKNGVAKRCCHLFSIVLDGTLFVLTGNEDKHKSLDEFEIRPDLTTYHITELAAHSRLKN